MSRIQPDGDALVRAKKTSRKLFEKTVKHYREHGATDQEIINAMVRSKLMIDRLGKSHGRR